MTNWKITLAYDGTDFHGWQVQPELRTLQGTLAAAIATVTGEQVLPQGSGRTDAGVHALEQVASFQLEAAIPAANLLRALNHTLPAAMRVLTAEPVAEDFHARHSARGKVYQYRVFPSRGLAGGGAESATAVCSPFLARTVNVYPWRLDLGTMQQAAQHVLGEHDFSSFAAVDPDVNARNAEGVTATSMVRTILHSTWTEDEAGLLIYDVRGNGFLHHMVRNLVGTFLEVGRGRMRADDVPGILSACERSQAGPTAAAAGLFLMKVEYEKSSC